MPTSLTPIERSVLKHLAAGKDDIQTAAAVHVPVVTVTSIQERFGPGVDRIRQVLDAADMPAQPTPIRPAAPRSLPGTGFEVFKKPVEKEPLAQNPESSTDLLLAEASKHSLAKIRNKAERIRDQIGQLRQLVDEEAEQEAARKKEAAEREVALDEVRKLEEQLAAARTKAGLKPIKVNQGKPSNMNAARANQDNWLKDRNVTLSDVLRWAREQGIQERGSLLSKATRKAWDAQHDRQVAS